MIHSNLMSLPPIAFVSPAWPAGSVANGIVTYTATIASALRRFDVRPFVITSGSSPLDPLVRTVPPPSGLATRLFRKVLHPVAANYAQDWMVAAGLLREIRRLHDEENLGLVEMEESCGWARLVARKSPIPVVVRMHGPWFINGAAVGAPHDRDFKRRDRVEGLGIAAAAGVSAGCRSVLERTRQHFGLPLPDAEVIPYAIQPIPAAEQWSLTGCERGRVLFVGRFDRHKGGDIMLQAFSRVVREMPKARLDMVGPDAGVDQGGRLVQFPEFLKAIFGASAGRAAIEMHGFQPLDRLPPYRRRAQVTVMCSRDEVFPLSALDALARGCPLIASCVGGLAEMVQDGRNGLLFENEDVGGLAEKLLLLLRNPELCARLGQQAAEDCASLYHPDTVARQTLDFYERVLGRWSPSRRRAIALSG